MTRLTFWRSRRPVDLEPIELNDDGLRVTRSGQLRGYPLVCLHNPSLIAQIAAVKAQRKVIREANERMFA
ncbi:hypothetical protein [Synechococcus phage Yong-M3-232]|nr:hypothetical protein [Synechococcus phage Yong-M3-232]